MWSRVVGKQVIQGKLLHLTSFSPPSTLSHLSTPHNFPLSHNPPSHNLPSYNLHSLTISPSQSHPLSQSPPPSHYPPLSSPGNNPATICKNCNGEKTNFCTVNDPYAGNAGALLCLKENQGDVAFVRDINIKKMFKIEEMDKVGA